MAKLIAGRKMKLDELRADEINLFKSGTVFRRFEKSPYELEGDFESYSDASKKWDEKFGNEQNVMSGEYRKDWMLS